MESYENVLHKDLQKFRQKHRDKIGVTYNYLTTVDIVGKDKHRSVILKAICVCGEYTYVTWPRLIQGRTKSCGCYSDKARRDRIKDLSGQKFGRLTVLNRNHDVKSSKVFYDCICDCGKRKTVSSQLLKNGSAKSCGCYREQIKHSLLQDLSGQKFGRLTVIEYDHGGRPAGTFYKCRCDCGKQIVVSRSHLVDGHTNSCGCYNKERIHETHFKNDMIGEKFGKLTVLEYVGRNQKLSAPVSLYKCQCECGSITTKTRKALVCGATKSCGCMKSFGQMNVASWLQQRNIQYEQHVRPFDDLLGPSGGMLQFDFMIRSPKYGDFFIQFQGIQHYYKMPNGFGDQQRQITDISKRNYCSQHCIKLCQIRYDEDIDSRMRQIMQQCCIEYNERSA